MGTPKRRRSDRAGRPATWSRGRPPVARREDRQRFWAAIARGLQSEDAAVEAGCRPRWRSVVPRGWRDAVGHPGTAVGALLVVRGARGDRAVARPRLRGAGDRAPDRPLGLDALAGASSECRHARWRPGVSGDDRAVACGPSREAPQAGEARGQPAAAGVRAGPSAGRDRATGRDPCVGSGCAVDRPASWPPQGPALGAVVEPGADLRAAARRVPR